MFGNFIVFTLVHVLLSVIGIVAGLVVVGAFMSGKRFSSWDAIFLVTTILTNVTGFLFPFVVLMPSHILGGLSLVALAIALVALYGKHLTGGWRGVYVVTAVVALYFNVFVLIAQLFHRIPAMIALAPQQKEPPFAVTQLVVLVIFVVLGRAAWKGFVPSAAVAR